MFTGIIENLAKLNAVQLDHTNKIFTIESSLAAELKVDQSVAHDGVCLTVVNIKDNSYQVIAVAETLSKSNLNLLQVGHLFNLERSMMLQTRLDGHIVQGHVDAMAQCIAYTDLQGSHLYRFELTDKKLNKYIVNKGSVAINGVSLTVCNATMTTFEVNIIPYTFEFTNFKTLQINDFVNIEFDIIGKYVERMLSFTNTDKS